MGGQLQLLLNLIHHPAAPRVDGKVLKGALEVGHVWLQVTHAKHLAAEKFQFLRAQKVLRSVCKCLPYRSGWQKRTFGHHFDQAEGMRINESSCRAC